MNIIMVLHLILIFVSAPMRSLETGQVVHVNEMQKSRYYILHYSLSLTFPPFSASVSEENLRQNLICDGNVGHNLLF